MKIKIVLLGLLLATGVSMKVEASGNLSNVEAMFIYNFLRHVNWPENAAGETFVIGVYGDNQVYDQLQIYTKNRTVGSKSIVVRKIASVNEASACQMIFVSSEMHSKISSMKNQVGSKPVLIVGEKEGAIAAGSTIEFLLEGDKLKFRIDEQRAAQQNLVFSRSLLDMAAN